MLETAINEPMIAPMIGPRYGMIFSKPPRKPISSAFCTPKWLTQEKEG